jgi:uncharacterized membrane protein
MNIKHEEEELKKEFQLERVILFTDAVFAIIITIMVLDLKLPEGISKLKDAGLHNAYKELAIKFSGYLITFALVARFWMVHLKLFKYLKDYDKTLLVLNLVFIFAISLFPFAVPLITGNIHIESDTYSWVLVIYACIVYSVVFMQALIASYLVLKRGILVIDSPLLEENLQWKIQKINLFVIPVLVIAVLAFNYFELSFLYTLSTIAAYGIISGLLTQRFYPEPKEGLLLVRLFRIIRAREPKQIVKKKK